MRIFYFLFSIFFLGCLIRTYTVEKPRVDLELTGNQGYILGSPPAGYEPKKELPPTRKITVVEIELGQHPSKVSLPQVQEEVPPQPQEEAWEIEEEALSEEVVLEEPQEEAASSIEASSQKVSQEEYVLYTVEKNDTLQKISYKFYKTTKRWKQIYEVNKEILKAPDKIYPGQVLKIPKD